jgi:hypothetical protein
MGLLLEELPFKVCEYDLFTHDFSSVQYSRVSPGTKSTTVIVGRSFGLIGPYSLAASGSHESLVHGPWAREQPEKQHPAFSSTD